MKLRGREKYFWERNFNIKNAASIPTGLDGITGIDSDHDDEFFYFLSQRVTTIRAIHLRCTNITDEAVRYISEFKGLKELMLKDHRNITSKCLPYLQKLKELEYLDLSKNEIRVSDLHVLTGFNRLSELYISRDMLHEGETSIPQSLVELFPGCTIHMY
jgi:hypothetical protein